MDVKGQGDHIAEIAQVGVGVCRREPRVPTLPDDGTVADYLEMQEAY